MMMPDWLDSPIEWLLALVVLYVGGQTFFAFRHDRICKRTYRTLISLYEQVQMLESEVKTLKHGPRH